jgi:hypothetical protein
MTVEAAPREMSHVGRRPTLSCCQLWLARHIGSFGVMVLCTSTSDSTETTPLSEASARMAFCSWPWVARNTFVRSSGKSSTAPAAPFRPPLVNVESLA